MNTQYLDSWIFNWHVFFCSIHVLHLLLGCFLIQNAHLNQEKTHIYPDGRVFTGVFPDISGSIHGKTMSGFLASKRFKTHKVQKCQEWVQVRSSNLDKTRSKAYIFSNEHLHAFIMCVCPSIDHLGTSCTIPFFLGTCQMSQSKTHGGLSQQLFQNRPILASFLPRKTIY